MMGELEKVAYPWLRARKVTMRVFLKSMLFGFVFRERLKIVILLSDNGVLYVAFDQSRLL
jgi:hypothetical protein